MVRKCVVVFITLLAISCDTKTVYTEYRSLDNGIWSATDTLDFGLKELDSTLDYNVFLNVRNNNEFAFSNLFLITELERPNGETTKDTLEYEMALPDGSWLGKGQGSIKESKLWFREKIVFPDSGVYHIRVVHAMRKNGQVEGIDALTGITDVGIQIEKTD